MKRLCGLMVLMLVSSSAHADTISFSVGGHRIRIEAPRGCRSSSCASIAIPGIYESRSKRDDVRDVAAPPPSAPAPTQAAPPPAAAPAQPPVPQSAPPAPKQVIVSAQPPAVYKAAALATQEVASPPPLPPVPQAQPATVASQPCTTPPVAKADDAVRPASPPALNILHEEDAADSPLGDWRTEGRG